MGIRVFIRTALIAASAPVVACTGYLFALTVFSRRRSNPEPTSTSSGEPALRMTVVVPAHNEEKNIRATVRSLAATDYPAGLRRVLVVADNCTDATAERAREAGATVLVREDPSKRGKGYALDFAFADVLRAGTADAVVVVDADTEVSPNLLRAFAARFERGAPAVQARYGVRNRTASWRTRLLSIGLALFHDLRSLAREELQLSCGLRGNGMGFRASVLAEVPHDAYSIVEDVEYGIKLGRLGHRVWYVDEAEVLGEMVATEKESRSQRRRWEGGRRKLALTVGPRLFLEGLSKRDPVLLDLAMDTLVPPLSYVALAVVGGTMMASAAVFTGLAGPTVLVPWLASGAFLGAYVVRGVLLSGAGLRGFVDLASAPAYVVWKVGLAFRGDQKKRNPDEWVRTARAGENSP